MANQYGPRIVTDGLVLHLDAANSKSYPGSGTVWNDLSGNNYHLTLSNSSVYVNNGSRSHMNFENGIAKYLPGGVLTDIPQTNTAACTIVIFSTIKAPDNNWKTLVRGATADHQVIVSSTDGITLGMYDNNSGQFISSGFSLASIPDRTTTFNYMAWKLNTSSPYYDFFYNNNLNVSQATITAIAATHNNGFSCIGAHHNETSSPTAFTQPWGKIALFLFYNRHLSSNEMLINYSALKGRFSL